MSILQDLHRYRLELQESTNSTADDINAFLESTGYYLDELLYRESVCNQYIEYLKTAK